MQQLLTSLTLARRTQALNDAEFAAGYFLHWQYYLHGERFAARLHRQQPKPRFAQVQSLLSQPTSPQRAQALADFLSQQQFRGIIPAVGQALARWLRQQWDLRLHTDIPSPAQVLTMQAQGRRPVTIICDYPRLLRPVLTKENAFAFAVHDLEHAFKFFHDPQLHREQRALFRLLDRARQQGLFAEYARDPAFAARLDYLLSDMNTHVIHSLHYLRAMLVDYFLARAGTAPGTALAAGASRELNAWALQLAQIAEFSPPQALCISEFFAGHYHDAGAAELQRAVCEHGG